MTELVIAIVAIAALIAAALWANRRFHPHDRLPMQWSVTGKVNWTAPRRVALAFIPALGALILAGMAAAVLAGVPTRPGQEHLTAPVMLCLAATILAAYAFHLWLINRTVR